MLAQHRPFMVTTEQSAPLAFGNDAIGEIVKPFGVTMDARGPHECAEMHLSGLVHQGSFDGEKSIRVI